ncbi:hypothetical protein HJG60_011151 [Phyllostomus discolor]|uniref:Uncharacterized protein n=1 Tax=Phyllostomus discolor TaxID=89673 RepID=A0A834E539_9CHIR|nr:hypothetical protein HJG60_011151 [Phyllostomus discolor]
MINFFAFHARANQKEGFHDLDLYKDYHHSRTCKLLHLYYCKSTNCSTHANRSHVLCVHHTAEAVDKCLESEQRMLHKGMATRVGLLKQFLRGAADTQLWLSGFKASGFAREARSFGCLLDSVSEFNCQQLIF